jgi:hypothetical protein
LDFILENTRQNDSPEDFWGSQLLWKILFFSVLVGHCLCYAPYGVNETDGGFLTGLAWQVLSGKALYSEVAYVRPPLPVWLRASELLLLPDNFAVLGERWIFYLKIGLHSWLGSAVLTSGTRRWMLATFGFVVSAHCYPPMAWHTVDGILFSALGVWFLAKMPTRRGAILAGISIFAALLCKQSFYPMAVVFFGLSLNHPTAQSRRMIWGIGTFLLCTAFFFSYLHSNDLLENYFQMTGASTSGSQALQHGLLDFFRIKPLLALGSAVILTPVAWYFLKEKNVRIAAWAWAFWLAFLAASYALEIWNRQEFTAPFAQARLLFGVGLLSLIFIRSSFIVHHLSLFAVSWCAAVSWGYNLPILFSTPWVFAALEISGRLRQQACPRLRLNWLNVCSLIMLLAVFRLGYEFVYRDGRRSEMNAPMGAGFPQLSGIYSTLEKSQLYLELKNLAAHYPNFKTLPAFPQANFLTKTRPPLPLDWVVRRETNGDNTLILKNLRENQPVLFIEKKYAEQIQTDPELSLTRELLQKGAILEETPHFWVVKAE